MSVPPNRDEDRRPDPESFLERARDEAEPTLRGKLKVFFGAAAGVGKTFAMLAAAQQKRAEGVDVVVGLVETHGRAETAALLEGLEILPRRRVDYRGTVLEELDIDAALARRPEVLLVDELAHTNVPGSRHKKRWQDVLELVEAGIGVYTTVNVQHLESLNDVVAQITGVVVRETVPDSLLERAAEVELVDLPPEELLQRLREGKVYIPAQAERAAASFFRRGNLIALRELSLRRTADRVDDEVRDYRRDRGIEAIWPVSERIVVCVSPSPFSARLVRATARMAAGLRASFEAVFVETPAYLRLGPADRARVVQHRELAVRLGGRAVIVRGEDVARELLAYARANNVTKIVVGKPTHPRWRDAIKGSLLDDIVRGSGDIDVYVITGERGGDRPARAAPPAGPRRVPEAAGYAWAVFAAAVSTAVGLAAGPHADRANLVLGYLLGVVAVAIRFGHGPSVLVSLLGVLCFDYFFVPPLHSFAVADPRHAFTFALMLLVALVVSGLTVRTRKQAEGARTREQRTAALYELSRELSSLRGVDRIAAAAVAHMSRVFGSAVVVLLPDAAGNLVPHPPLAAPPLDERELGVARWVFDHAQAAGLGTDTLPSAAAMYLPLIGGRGTVGVLGVRPGEGGELEDPERRDDLETFADQTALAVERTLLARQAAEATPLAKPPPPPSCPSS
jgi:two-component system sensor histidine kinase KdpD